MAMRDKIQIRKPALWISYWLAFSSLIQAWDAGYCFNRPRSMPGGDLSWIWKPYNMVPYARIDWIYGQQALDANDGYTAAQALMNVLEIILHIEYLYLRHFSSRTTRAAPGTVDFNYHGHAPIVGFAAATMTWSKTALYFIQEYFCGWCNTKQNTTKDLILYYFMTNGWWILMPVLVSISLGQFISSALNRDFADQIAYAEWRDTHSGLATSPKRTNGAGASGTEDGGAEGTRRTPARAAKGRRKVD